MKNPTISLGFSTYTDENFSLFTENIIQSMTGNPNFTTPVPALTDVQTALDDFNAKLTAVYQRGTKEAYAAKNQSRKTLEGIVKQLALYVITTCAGDEVKMLSSGYNLTKQPEPAGNPLQPQNLQLGDGPLSGEVLVKFDRVTNARGYQGRYMNGDAQWLLTDPFTRSRFVISGLEKGKEYQVQVRSSNAYGISEWSTAASLIVR
jgi:hypothetical protein